MPRGEQRYDWKDSLKPGDVVEKEYGAGVLRYTVLDPPRTGGGKLRLQRESGSILTTWWNRASQLPRGYRALRNGEQL